MSGYGWTRYGWAMSALARPLVALAVVTLALLAFLLGGCSSADSETAEPETARSSTSAAPTSEPGSEPEPPRSTTTSTNSTVPEPPPQPASISEYEALWRQERQAIVETLSQGPYGLGDDGVLRGPGRFRLDTTQCPDGWSNTAGLDGETVSLVQLAPMNVLSNAGGLATGTKAYFDRLNDRGGIGPDGLRVDFAIKDDSYIPSISVQVVQETFGDAEPLAFSTFGGPPMAAVVDGLNEQCVPLLMGLTSTPVGADPEGRPWSTGLQMPMTTEALLWVESIERAVAADGGEPVRVAAVVMDNSFGWTYEQAFAEAAAGSDAIERFDVVHHDPAAAFLTDEMAEIAALEPDVYISMTAGNPCLLAMQEAARVKLTQSARLLFTPSACTQPVSYLKPADQDGHGWLAMLGGLKDSTAVSWNGEWADDPWITHVNQELRDLRIDPAIGIHGLGYGFRGWAMHQVLEIAAALDGGLTRTNLILAQRGLTEMTHPMLVPGVQFGMNGDLDPHFIEGSQLARYDADNHRWVTLEVIDLNGQTPPCEWIIDQGCQPDQ